MAIFSVSWSPDGRRLATGSDDHTVKIWEADTLQELLVLREHLDRVYSVAWSPDGRRLASVSIESVKIWDAPEYEGAEE